MYKILVIEDSKVLKLAQVRLLTRAGYQVVSAEDGEEGLAVGCSDNPDAILLDMMLPKISGPEVLNRLKRNSITADIPVIVMTALSQKNEQKLREDGASAFFGKSQLGEDPQSFLRVLENVLKPENIAQPESQTIPPNVITQLVDSASLGVRG